MAAGSIIIDLLMRTGSFETDTARAAKTAEKRSREISDSFRGAADVINKSFASLGVGLSFAGLAAFTKRGIDLLDALNDAADATGASIENLSALERIAVNSGASLDTVTGALVKFNAAVSEADPAKGAGAVLKSIGLDAEQLKRIDPAEALRQTAVALAQFADDGAKARAVQELFGKSVREVAPFLKDVAEAGELNASALAAQAAEAEAFNKQLARLQGSVDQVARSIAGPAVTAVNELIARFERGAQRGDSFIKTLLRQTELANLIGLGDNSFRADSATPATALPSLGGQGRRPANEGGGRFDESIFKENLRRLDDGKRAAASQQRQIDSYIDSLKRQLDATRELSTVEQTLADIREGRAGNVSSAQQNQLIGIAREIDAIKERTRVLDEAEKKRKEIAEAARKDQERITEAARKVFEETRTPAEVLNRELSELNKLLEQGAIDWETYGRAQDAAQDRYDDAQKRIRQAQEQQKTLAQEIGLTFTSSFESAITAGKALSDVLDGLAKDILALTTRRLVTDPLGKSLDKFLGSFSKSSSDGGLLGSLFGSFFGSRAGGGDVMGGGAYLVGEQGPEMFVPRTAGTVVPTQGTVGAGRTTVNRINITVPQGTPRQTAEQMAAELSRRLAAAGARGN